MPLKRRYDLLDGEKGKEEVTEDLRCIYLNANEDGKEDGRGEGEEEGKEEGEEEGKKGNSPSLSNFSFTRPSFLLPSFISFFFFSYTNLSSPLCDPLLRFWKRLDWFSESKSSRSSSEELHLRLP